MFTLFCHSSHHTATRFSLCEGRHSLQTTLELVVSPVERALRSLGWIETRMVAHHLTVKRPTQCSNYWMLQPSWIVDYYTISLARFVKYGAAFSAQLKPTHECILKFIANAAVNVKFLKKAVMVMNLYSAFYILHIQMRFTRNWSEWNDAWPQHRELHAKLFMNSLCVL